MRREQEARRVKRVRETDRNREMSASDYRRTPTEHSSSGKEDYGKGKKIIKTLFKITVVILVIYFVIAFVRIFSVRHSTYDFDTEMKLAITAKPLTHISKTASGNITSLKIRCPMRELPKVATIML